uniref:ribosomal protein S19 n=1 Tax=Hydnora longicollis TaxID=1778543 RepID=UPI0021159A08|nr:ribosomal protein S19 [Hydnora longicollis]USN93659.1 ribosomal protein S19 [Hydnora longicollis]
MKNVFIHNHILQKIKKTKGQENIIKTWSRSSNIIPTMVGHIFSIYNGKIHVPIFITKLMIGHKIGEFVPTLKFLGHKEKKRLKKRAPKHKSKLTSATYKPESKKIIPKRKKYSSKKKKAKPDSRTTRKSKNQ